MRTPKNKSPGVLGAPRGFITVRRAMEIGQCSEPTVRRLIRRRTIGVIRVRHRVLLREAELRLWLKPRPYTPEKPTPKCAGWNDKLRTELAQAGQEGATP
jgi:excisionase family DNA binding protein